MINIKYIYTPQESIYDTYEYQFNSTTLKIKHTMLLNNEYVVKELYYNIENLELNKNYSTQHPLIKIETINDELVFNLLYALPTEEEYATFEPEILDVKFEEFEIPEDAEIIKLSELMFPDFEEQIDPVVELAEANNKIAELETYVNKTKADNEALILSTIEMMTEMMMMR